MHKNLDLNQKLTNICIYKPTIKGVEMLIFFQQQRLYFND